MPASPALLHLQVGSGEFGASLLRHVALCWKVMDCLDNGTAGEETITGYMCPL